MTTKLPDGIAFRNWERGCPPGSLRAYKIHLDLRADGFEGWMRMCGTGDLPERFDLADYSPYALMTHKPSPARVVRTEEAEPVVWFASDERREE